MSDDLLTWKGTPEQARRGSSLGNPDCFLRADAEANIDGLWLAANSRWYCGELAVHILQLSGMTLREVVCAPAYQAAIYANAAGARVEKRLFLAERDACAYLWIRGQGFAAWERVEIVCDWRPGAARSETHRAQPFGQDCERQWKISAEDAYGLRVHPSDGEAEETSLRASEPLRSRAWTEPGRARLLFHAPAAADGTLEIWLQLTAQAQPSAEEPTPAAGREFPPDVLAASRSVEAAVAETIGSQIAPNGLPPVVEQAVMWCKACSRRVWHRYGTGDWGFTNDPPGNTVVTRDAAWFLFGADHFAPEWSRELLHTLARHAVYPDGKIAEYVRLSPSGIERDDYGLNINDATPLFILAVAHHWRMTHDQAALSAFYPAVTHAARWIKAQIREDGLVWCDGRKTNVWGIAGWRNIIPGYRLSGALTELNAECVAALREAALLAGVTGDRRVHENFMLAAQRLDDAMAQLVDPQTGYFLLTRDENGPNPQLAVDLALPALFQAGPEEASVRTLLRLAEDDFRGPHGLRCLSRNDPAYHPRFGWGLMGGSWPNATAWAAAALAPYRRELAWELTEELARALFPETWAAPGVGVPGQFPEWFDGDTGESAGMSLSPWMPATYVWLVEEALGHPVVRSSGDDIALSGDIFSV
jgi:hypothetical protein